MFITFFLLILLMAKFLSRDSMTSKCCGLLTVLISRRNSILNWEFLNSFQEDTVFLWTIANKKYIAIFYKNQEIKIQQYFTQRKWYHRHFYLKDSITELYLKSKMHRVFTAEPLDQDKSTPFRNQQPHQQMRTDNSRLGYRNPWRVASG